MIDNILNTKIESSNSGVKNHLINNGAHRKRTIDMSKENNIENFAKIVD